MKCIECAYTPDDTESGGTVSFRTENGFVTIDYMVLGDDGVWVENPLINYLGLNVSNGKCSCFEEITSTDAYDTIGEYAGSFGINRTGGILSNSPIVDGDTEGKKRKAEYNYGAPFDPGVIYPDLGDPPDFTLGDIVPFMYGGNFHASGEGNKGGGSTAGASNSGPSNHPGKNDPRKRGLTLEGPISTDFPCNHCNYIPHEGNPPWGGDIAYYGGPNDTVAAIPYKVPVIQDGKVVYIVNPILTQGGGSVGADGKCRCKSQTNRARTVPSASSPASGSTPTSGQWRAPFTNPNPNTTGNKTRRFTQLPPYKGSTKNTFVTTYFVDGTAVGQKTSTPVSVETDPIGLDFQQTLDLFGSKFGIWFNEPINQQNLLNSIFIGAGGAMRTPFVSPRSADNWSSSNTRGRVTHPSFLDYSGQEPDIIEDADIQDRVSKAIANAVLKFKLETEKDRMILLINKYEKDLECIKSPTGCTLIYNWGSGNDDEMIRIITTTIAGAKKRLQELIKNLERLG
jgi:hypothetical protein